MIGRVAVTLYRRLRTWVQGTEEHERTRELMGALMTEICLQKLHVDSLHDVEFRVHSQFGDDGIIQWLTAHLPTLPKRFVEFGVEDYSESNTRFLMVHRNWAGLVMDGSRRNMRRLRSRRWYWRYDLSAVSRFVTRENVDALIAEWARERPVGLLHVDIDGNDYWVWDAIKCISPGIVIMEYNAVFGSERAITIPYRPDFQRFASHHSGQYAGASLAALTHLATVKGYALIGSNSAGNNAYFIRRDLLHGNIREVSVEQAFVRPNYRETRDPAGRLDFLSFEERQANIRGLPVIDVITGKTEPF